MSFSAKNIRSVKVYNPGEPLFYLSFFAVLEVFIEAKVAHTFVWQKMVPDILLELFVPEATEI